MRELLVSITLVSLITSLSLAVMPEGSLKKYVKLACALVFLAFAVSKLTHGGIEDITLPKIEIEDKTDEFNKAVAEKTKEITEKNVRDAVRTKFEIAEDDIEVKIELLQEQDGLVISDVHIRIYGIKNAVKVTAVKKYVSGLLDCEVTAESAE